MSHQDYLATCDEEQTQSLLHLCKEKLDNIKEEGWVHLWVLSDEWTDMKWFRESDYKEAVTHLANMCLAENSDGYPTEIHLQKAKYRPSEVEGLLKV